METNPSPPAAEPRSSFLEEKAFESRTVLVFGAITDSSAADTARRLVALDAASKAPIDMLVSSPGGHLESGDALHDIVRFIAAPVRMIGTGWVGSAATHLFLAAPQGTALLPRRRRASWIHQPSGGAGGQASDIAIQAREILKARERIARVIAWAGETGHPLEAVLVDIERDRWLSAEEAVEYGLVSRIISTRTDSAGLTTASRGAAHRARRASPARRIESSCPARGRSASAPPPAPAATSQTTTTRTAPPALRGFARLSRLQACACARQCASTGGGNMRSASQIRAGSSTSSSTRPSTGMKSGIRSIGLSA